MFLLDTNVVSELGKIRLGRADKNVAQWADSVNGLAPKAVIGAVMRKLAHLIYGVIKSGEPFSPELAMPKLDFQDGI